MADKTTTGVYGAIRAVARRIPLSRRAYHALTREDREEALTRERDRLEIARGEAQRRYDELKRICEAMGVDVNSGPVLTIPKFWEPNYWETTVQFPLRDYCRPGDVVFDVGANAGGLTMLMSRLVGPRGIVCAFEASPRIVGMTLRNLVNGGCNNVQLYNRAIYHTSHESIAIYAGSHLNDSIYPVGGPPPGAEMHNIETLALDDFVESTKLVPKLIKMDIEGAEFDVLQGMKRLLADAKPVLILEQSPKDMRCHALLTERGYVAVDLANYRRIRSAADFDSGVSVANILFVHASTADDPYLQEAAPETVAKIGPSGFVRSENGGFEIEKAAELPAGRYICRADFSAAGRDNEIFCGIEVDGKVVLRYHTYTNFMAASYRDWVFTLRKTSYVKPYFRFLRGKDETLEWRGVTIVRLPQFDNLPPPVVD